MDKWVFEIGKHEKRVSSQGGQDGVIEFICSQIEIDNEFCVEFGYDADTLSTGCGPNTTALIKREGWKYLLLDGGHENKDINLHKHFITSDNICELFRQYEVPKKPGYVSIDVDSTDLWVTDALLREFSPSFYSVEFNPNFPIDHAITFPNTPDEFWEQDRVFGASLKALKMVANAHGYSLVYAGVYRVHGHHDAFFVRDDLLRGSDIPEFEDFRPTMHGIHSRCKSGREGIMLNYETWLQTNDAEKSRAAALPICQDVLGKSTFFKRMSQRLGL